MGLIGKVIKSLIKNSLREIQTEIWTQYIKSSRQVLPPGMDSVPIEGDQGIIIMIDQTEGKTIAIGVYPDPQAESGEVRFYARNDSGVEQSFLWIKKDGTIEINGDTDFAVAFNDLKVEFNKLNSEYNKLVSRMLAWTPVPTDGGTALKTAITVPPTVAVSGSNIDNAKVAAVRLP